MSMFAACGESPTQPTPSTQPGGGGQIQARLLGLEVTVPLTIAIGESVQLTARGRYSDGSSRDVTGQVAWITNGAEVLSVSATGRATGRANGEADVSAKLDEQSAWQSGVIVVPAGTFRLSGNVMDETFAISGATVTVLSGRGQGLTATSSFSLFQIYGVAGDIAIRISKPGYQDLTRELHIAKHEWLRFDLALANDRERLSDTYELRVLAANECRSVLPEVGHNRKYIALFRQEGASLAATLQGATFVTTNNQMMNTFSGVVQPDQITFYLDSEFTDSFPFPKVFEQINASTYYAVSGTVSARMSSSGVIGTLDGTIQMLDGPAPYARSASCTSAGHRFELTK
jgi:Big-like domain-containing protein